jgi:hypothetical protein
MLLLASDIHYCSFCFHLGKSQLSYTVTEFQFSLFAGMLLQRCHLLLRPLYSFMLAWMPWILRSGEL